MLLLSLLLCARELGKLGELAFQSLQLERDDHHVREDDRENDEVRGIEQEQNQEEDELILVPFPPVSPAVTGPDRTGEERERAEDHALMDCDVAFQVGVVVPLPEYEESLPPAPREAGVGGQGDADVKVEDLLVEPVLVERRVEEDEGDRG